MSEQTQTATTVTPQDGTSQGVTQTAAAAQTGTQQATGAQVQGTQAATGTEGGQQEVFTKEDIQKIVQARLADEQKTWQQKVAGLDKHKAVAERLQKIAGVEDPEALLQQLEAYAIQMEAQTKGVPVAVERELQTAKQVAQQTQDQLADFRLDREELSLKANPVYSDFDAVKDAVRDYAKKTGTSLEAAYWAVQGPQRATQLQREVEQRVLLQQQQAQTKGGTQGDGTSTDGAKLTLSPEQLDIAAKMGIDPMEYQLMLGVETYAGYKALKK